MVSRYLEGLERWLGARLLHRTTRRVEPERGRTGGAAAIAARCSSWPTTCRPSPGRAAPSPWASCASRPACRSRVSSLTQAVVEFQRRHPRIEVELVTVDRAVNLVGERIDLAVRITNRLDEGFVARRLASCRSVSVRIAGLSATARPTRTPGGSEVARLHHARLRLPRRVPAAHDGKLVTVASKGPLSSNETAVLRKRRSQAPASRCCPPTSSATILRAARWCVCCRTTSPSRWASTPCTCRASTSPSRCKLLIDFLAERFGGDVAAVG